MADIRIKDLTTLESASLTGDVFVIDGTTGTRKLSAFSPTFGGNATVTGTLTVNGTSATVGSGTGSIGSTLNGAAGNYKLNIYQSGGSDRWYVGLAAGAESGSNGGAPYTITALTDAGAVIDNPLLITRAAGGSITTPRPVSISATTASTTTSSGALVVGNGTSGGLGVGGAINAGGLILSSGSTAGLGAESRDGSGYRATWYNPTGDDMQLDFAGIGTKFTITSAGNTTLAGTLTVNGGTASVASANGTTSSMIRSTVGGTATTGNGIFSSYLSSLIEWQFGGVSSDSSFRISSNGLGTADQFKITSSGNVSIPSTAISTTTSSGALVVSGGVGVAGAGFFGGNIVAAGNVVCGSATNQAVSIAGGTANDGGNVIVYGSTHASDPNTGRIRVGTTTITSWDSNDFTIASGKGLKVGNAYAAGAPTATGYIVIKDSTGTSYKIPAVAL